MKSLPETDIYAVLSNAHSLGRGNVETARLLLTAGVRIIQYREKDFTAQRKFDECLAIRDLCREYGACFIVNDDAALAAAVGADGLHIGQFDLQPAAARDLIMPEMILGLSVTNRREIDAALSSGQVIDYLGVGPIFDAASTKPDAAAPGGLALVDYALKRSALPVVAIGGIRLENISSLAGRGVRCFSLISDLVGAADLGQRVDELRAAIAFGRKTLPDPAEHLGYRAYPTP
jgi:thiamine-phosphate pyrophosphorylase